MFCVRCCVYDTYKSCLDSHSLTSMGPALLTGVSSVTPTNAVSLARMCTSSGRASFNSPRNTIPRRRGVCVCMCRGVDDEGWRWSDTCVCVCACMLNVYVCIRTPFSLQSFIRSRHSSSTSLILSPDALHAAINEPCMCDRSYVRVRELRILPSSRMEFQTSTTHIDSPHCCPLLSSCL